MEIDPKLIKSSFLSNKIKHLLNKKDITITEISEKIGASRPSISNILNGKVVGSDNIFKKILKVLGLTDREIKEIFKEADLETIKYKYGEDVLCGNFDVAFKREFGRPLDQKTKEQLKKFFDLVDGK